MANQYFMVLLFLLFTGCINNVEQNDPKFSAVAVPEHAGSVTPSSGSIIPTDSIDLFAAPNLGYAFGHWNQDPSDCVNPKPFTFVEDAEVTANFRFDGFLNMLGGGSGTIPVNIVKKGNQVYFAGTTLSNEGIFEGLRIGENNVYFGVLEPTGEFRIINMLGGTFQEYLLDFIPSNDDQFILTGTARSADGDFPIPSGNVQDVFIAKVDEFGSVLWKRVLGGTGIDFVSAIIPYQNGYLVSGATYSKDGFLGIDESYKSLVAYLLKLNEQGETEWIRLFDGENDDVLSNLQIAEDGSILATGQTTSKDGFFENNLELVSTTFTSKISSSGDIQWTTHYPTNGISRIYDSKLQPDKTLILVGSEKFTPDLNNILVTKLDVTTGQILWSKTYGGSADDNAFSLETHDDDIYVAGAFFSEDDIFSETRFQSKPNAFILKLDAFGELTSKFLLVGNSDDRIVDITIENDLLYYMGFSASTEYAFSFRDGIHSGDRDMFIGVKELKDFED